MLHVFKLFGVKIKQMFPLLDVKPNKNTLHDETIKQTDLTFEAGSHNSKC